MWKMNQEFRLICPTSVKVLTAPSHTASSGGGGTAAILSRSCTSGDVSTAPSAGAAARQTAPDNCIPPWTGGLADSSGVGSAFARQGSGSLQVRKAVFLVELEVLGMVRSGHGVSRSGKSLPEMLAAYLASRFDVQVVIAGFQLLTVSATRTSASTAHCRSTVRSGPLTPHHF